MLRRGCPSHERSILERELEVEPQDTDPTAAPQADHDKNARNLAVLCHLFGLLGLIIPPGNVIGPLLIWLLKKEDHPFIEEQGREALNFQISFTIAMMVSVFLALVYVGLFLLAILGIVDLILIIMASTAASRGENYRYPFSIKFLQ